MKPILNKWQFVLNNHRDYRYYARGWKFFQIGFINIHTMPEEATRLEKCHYKGFLFSFYYFFPIELD